MIMHFSRLTLFLILLSFLFSRGLLEAQNPQPTATENKLRESLRNTLLQLRNSENDKAVLQATQAELEDKEKALTAQVEALSKQLAADKDAAEKNATALQAKLDQKDKDNADLRESLDKWKVDHKRISEIAITKEQQRAKLETQNVLLNRRVVDQQSKNEGMFKIANEILQRYEKFGLGDALSAREPFTGITRVKLQSLFEEYRDKLVDQKIKPVESKSSGPAAATPSSDSAPKRKEATTKPSQSNEGSTTVH